MFYQVIPGRSDQDGGVGGFVGGIEVVGFFRREEAGDFGDGLADDVAPVFGAFALVGEFGVDVGPFGPFPEFLFATLEGIGFEDGEALLVEGEAAGS